MKSDFPAFLIIGLIFIFIFNFSAWLTHVIYCLQHHDWGFLIAGAIVFPIAIIHGIGIWFGFWH